MRCCGLAPIPTPLSIPDPKTRLQLSSACFFPVKLVSSPRRPPGSLRAKARATINDGFVTEEAASGLSFYELLGIPESGSLVEIKQAYKQLARKYHPDVSPPGRVDEYTKRFILVQEAYEILSDPRRRALYDRDMAKGLQLAFSARRYYESDEGMEDRTEWKNRWEAQLSELKRKSMNKDARGNLSWGARMRSRRDELANEL
ncbi:chaperone protein dnaJ 20, chloroplastic-like [Alnus glutinosa]|uniref:chaperone protein dnaJ 20, chloroplastic-like n=1 Tax=Alnus glutinosa TaxID=3517 RepID=UPI002D799DF0|nr:chaperone protein dnaJ 20, chloroplastic-like [Alnus glutinosa]